MKSSFALFCRWCGLRRLMLIEGRGVDLLPMAV